MCLLEVALLATLPADLAEEHSGEETDVPGEQVQPELIFEARALREVGQVSTDGVGESSEKRGIPVRLDGDAGGDGPAEQGQKVDSSIRLQPIIVEGLGLAVDDDDGRGGGKGASSWFTGRHSRDGLHGTAGHDATHGRAREGNRLALNT